MYTESNCTVAIITIMEVKKSLHGSKWLEEQDAFVIQNLEQSDEFIANALKRSDYAIACRRAHLAVKRLREDCDVEDEATTNERASLFKIEEYAKRFRVETRLVEKFWNKKKSSIYKESNKRIFPGSMMRKVSSPQAAISKDKMTLSMQELREMAACIMSELGAGYSECIYHNALYNKIVKRDSSALKEVTLPVIYDGMQIGTCRADIVTADYVIEVKALRNMSSINSIAHQIRKYLKHIQEQEQEEHSIQARERRGVLVNFNQESERLEFYDFNDHNEK